MAAEDFENRQQLRTEELEAVEKATEILKSGSVTGMADKHLPGFLQTSLVLRGSKVADPTIPSISKFLADRASQTGSKLLGLVAQKVCFFRNQRSAMLWSSRVACARNGKDIVQMFRQEDLSPRCV